MKLFTFVLILVALAFADGDGYFDDISLSVVNDWTLTETTLGMDIFEDSTYSYVIAVDSVNNVIHSYDPISGLPQSTMNMDPANDKGFGVVWNNDIWSPAMYTNDQSDNELYYTNDGGTTWTTSTNPSGNNGRGMDCDGEGFYWLTNGNGGGVWNFMPGLSPVNYATPEVPTEPSGLTAFPYGGFSDQGVAVTCYQTHNVYFYNYDSSTMTLSFIGSAACPVSGISSSLGLAYAEVNEHIYWSYKDSSGNYHLVEISFEITSLSHSSWGAIKNSF